MKRCSICKDEKALSEFYKDRTTKDGLDHRCKECKKNYKKKHLESTEGRKARKEEQKKYHQRYYRTTTGYLRRVYNHIKGRCKNPKDPAYPRYGGRGILCKFNSSDDFVNYVINELKIDPRGLTIDRIDNDGHYERGNIRFVTQAENNRNR